MYTLVNVASEMVNSCRLGLLSGSYAFIFTFPYRAPMKRMSNVYCSTAPLFYCFIESMHPLNCRSFLISTLIPSNRQIQKPVMEWSSFVGYEYHTHTRTDLVSHFCLLWISRSVCVCVCWAENSLRPYLLVVTHQPHHNFASTHCFHTHAHTHMNTISCFSCFRSYVLTASYRI